MLFFAYIGLSVTISVALLYLLPPSGVLSVLVFLTVAALLFAPFWPLFKKYYPESPKID